MSKLKGSEINEAKKILAYEVTKICRNLNESKKAENTAKNTFEKKSIDRNLNSFKIQKKFILNKKILLIDVLIKLKFISSRSEAKRLIKGGAVKINDRSISDINTTIENKFFENKNIVKISCGKKKFGLIELIN